MRYLSVCSGIEAATVAWHPLGWEPAGFAEIESFPSAVLAHHYPNVPNFGDMTNYKEWNLGAIDLLVGGTPCQSFSVAGLRKGLADPRGNLALVYCGILDHFRPKWCVWENVPGVLSSNGGRDFGSFLGALAELGYGFAYRVLDAQYFGVAQRRRRVFVVGYFGGWRPAAEVLFEPESLRRDTAPSREARQGVAGVVAPSLTASNDPSRSPQSSEVTQQVAAVVAARMVAFGEYVDDGTASAMKARDYKDATDLVAQPMAFDGYNQTLSTTSQTIRSDKTDGDHIGMVLQGVAQPISFGAQMSVPQVDFDLNQTLQAKNPMAVAQPVHCVDMGGNKGLNGGGILREFLQPLGTNEPHAISAGMAVRRLTPVECERLQGFPDNYTNIPWRKQPESPDGPRYKALGNSMAVPVMAWIGKRIQQYCIKNYDGIKVASAG